MATSQWLSGHLAKIQQAGGSHRCCYRCHLLLLLLLLLLLVWSSPHVTGLLLLVLLQSVLVSVSHQSRTPTAATHDHLHRATTHQVQRIKYSRTHAQHSRSKVSHTCHVSRTELSLVLHRITSHADRTPLHSHDTACRSIAQPSSTACIVVAPAVHASDALTQRPHCRNPYVTPVVH